MNVKKLYQLIPLQFGEVVVSTLLVKDTVLVFTERGNAYLVDVSDLFK